MLSPSLVRLCSFGNLSQPCAAIRILFPYPPVGEIFGPVNNDNQGPNFRTIDAHVRKYTGRMHGSHLCSCSHDDKVQRLEEQRTIREYQRLGWGTLESEDKAENNWTGKTVWTRSG